MKGGRSIQFSPDRCCRMNLPQILRSPCIQSAASPPMVRYSSQCQLLLLQLRQQIYIINDIPQTIIPLLRVARFLTPLGHEAVTPPRDGKNVARLVGLRFDFLT
jgi:hypothetical protein